MTAQITDHISITTDHPASHYGAGVLLVDWMPGVAFGPEDTWPEFYTELRKAMGSPARNCEEIIRYTLARREPTEAEIQAGVAIYPPKLNDEELALIQRWLSQKTPKK